MNFNYALLGLPLLYSYLILKNNVVPVLFLHVLATNNKCLKLAKWQQLARWQLYLFHDVIQTIKRHHELTCYFWTLGSKALQKPFYISSR